MKKMLAFALSCLLIAGTSACGNSSPAAETAPTASPAATSAPAAAAETAAPTEEPSAAVTFTDDLDREVTVESPERVAVLIGSFADIWCVAGGKDCLVAAPNDTWTSFDLGLSDTVANIGAIKEPSVETLLAADPEFVIGSTNTQADIDMMDTLEQAGITVAYFDVENFDDYLRTLDIFTQITGCTDNYKTYGTDLSTVIDAAIARQDDSHPSVLCIRATGSSVKVKGTEGYLLGEMLADLGCVNVADSDSGLLENLSMEAIMMDDPDYIFVVYQGSDTTEAEALMNETLLSNPAWESLRAVQDGRFIVLDNSLYNLKPNARWGEAYEKLADILYPEN